MKNCLLIISLFLIQTSVQAQAIPNSGFENWSNFTYDEPMLWFSSNIETVPSFSIPTVTPVAGFSGLAARIETYIIGNDTLKGTISNSNLDILAGEGGVPYTDQPTELTGYYRYNLPGNDTALILVIFKSGGVVISTDLFKIKGTGSEPNYVPFTFPLTLASTPDSVIIACTASNLITNQGISSGSWIEYDEFVFTGPSVTQVIPNGTFDNWNNQTIDNPLSWVTFGNGVTQSSDAYSGTSALGLQSIQRGNFVEISGASSGQQFGMGGFPFTMMTDSLVGYYKYLTAGADTAAAYVSTSLNGSPVGGGLMAFYPTSVYTPFSIPVNSNTNPDTMRIDFFSSAADSALDGSILLIDNLDFQSIITGINTKENKNSNLFSANPNPVSDKLHIAYNGQVQTLQTYIYNSLGEVVYESSSTNNRFEMEVSQLAAGCYWLKMISGDNVSVRKIIKQ